MLLTLFFILSVSLICPTAGIVLLMVVGVVAVFFHRLARSCLVFTLLVLFACIWSQCYRQRIYNEYVQHIPRVAVLTGYISGIPRHMKHSERFIFISKTMNHQRDHMPLLVTWYGHVPTLWPGDAWRITVHLKRPKYTPGFVAFNYPRWLLWHRVQLLAVVVRSPTNQRLLNEGHHAWLARYRSHIAYCITHFLGHTYEAMMLVALSVGIRSGVTAQAWQVFQYTGTNHLLAIAGLHVGMAALLGFNCCRLVLMCFPAVLRYVPVSRIATLSALLWAFFYALMSGFALPTQRATVMVATFLLAEYSFVRFTFFERILCAFTVVLLSNPLAYLSESFWLSLCAVSVIAYGMQGRYMHRFSKWHAWWRIQWVIALGLLPLSLWYFQVVSFCSVFANMLAIPWVNFVIIPIALFIDVSAYCFPWCVHASVLLAGFLLKPLWLYLSYLASWPHIAWVHPLFKVSTLCCAMVGVLFLLSPSMFRLRYLSIFFFLPLILAKRPKPPEGMTWHWQWFVHHHHVIVQESRQHTVVFVSNNTHVDAFLRQHGFNAHQLIYLPYSEKH